jgi:hypothetical protein
MGFGLVIGFIVHLQIVTASIYSTIANSHTLQFSTACTKFSQSAVFTCCCLVITSNTVGPSTSMFMSLLSGDFLAAN